MEELLNALHDYPLLQIVVAAVVAIGGTTAWLRGERDKKQVPDYGNSGVELFFNGPLIKALDLLQGVYRLLVEMRADAARFADENNRKIDEETAILREQLVVSRDHLTATRDLAQAIREQIALLRDIRDRQPRRH